MAKQEKAEKDRPSLPAGVGLLLVASLGLMTCLLIFVPIGFFGYLLVHPEVLKPVDDALLKGKDAGKPEGRQLQLTYRRGG